VEPTQHHQITTTLAPRRFGAVYQLLILVLLAALALGAGGCKAKKEARAAAAAKAETIAKARADLLSVINDQGSMTLEEKEEVVARIKDMNLQDAEIQNLIDRAEAAIAEERSATRNNPVTTAPSAGSGAVNASSVNNTMRDIARASGSEVNFKIQEAMSMFASPDTPVLIVISQSGDRTDYDEPTTIKKYLEYLKDTRNEPAAVKNLEFDANGKIKEVELSKNYNR
jgi:hypothetical protein